MHSSPDATDLHQDVARARELCAKVRERCTLTPAEAAERRRLLTLLKTIYRSDWLARQVGITQRRLNALTVSIPDQLAEEAS